MEQAIGADIGGATDDHMKFGTLSGDPAIENMAFVIKCIRNIGIRPHRDQAKPGAPAFKASGFERAAVFQVESYM